jgi:glycosyltransferase involved in cell wall biosynthesis
MSSQTEILAPTDAVLHSAEVGDASRAGEEAERQPVWAGRDGAVGYVAKMFPRISETFVLREIQALRRSGIHLRIYSLLPPTRDPRTHPAALALLPEVVVLPQPGWRTLGRLLADFGYCAAHHGWTTWREIGRLFLNPRPRTWKRFARAIFLAAHVHRDRVAHLHAAWAHTPASVVRAVWRITGVPWSMSAHAKDIHLSKPRSLAKKMRDARFTSACTSAHRELLRSIAAAHDGTGAAPSILLHHHGVDTRTFAPAAGNGTHAAVAGAPPLVLSVGRLVPKKGFDVLLEAAALLERDGVRFRLEIVGEGPCRAELEQRIRRLELTEVVELRGMLVQEEVLAAYRRATCVVLASRTTKNGDRDGIPNTLAEAMACGVAVVATRSGSIDELVHDGDTGLLVAPEDAGALAGALARLLGEPALRARLAGAARARVRRDFDGTTWGERIARRLGRTPGIERVLYLSADRGVPVRGGKGASVHVRAVVDALHRHGVEVTVVTTRRGPRDGPQLAAPLVETGSGGRWKRTVERLASRTGGGTPLARALLRLIDNVPVYVTGARLAMHRRPDLVYERYALTAAAGSLIARRFRVPHVVEVNAPLADEEARYRGLRLGAVAHALEGWILRRADRVVVVSRALEAHVERLGVASERIIVLPNAVDPARFHPHRDGRAVRRLHQLDGDFVIGFSGTLKPWHGLHHLLHAVARTATVHPATRLLVIGDGPERADLQELGNELGIEDRVRFVGHVDHHRVGDYLAACDVLVAPYGPIENHWFSPLKVAEYLAVGRPVVASAIGQLEELRDAPGMLLVPPGDEAALAEMLSRLAVEPDGRAWLARQAAAARPRTWIDVAGRVLAAGEIARREIWGWPS